MAKSYYFANYDLLQEFPEEQSYQDSKLFGSYSKYPDDFEQSNRVFDKPPPHEPKDIGIECYEIIKSEFKSKRYNATFDSDILYEFWWGLRKGRQNQPPPTNARPPSCAKSTVTAPGEKRTTKHYEDVRSHRQKLLFYLECHPYDVQMTLQIYAKQDQEDEEIQKRLKEQERKDKLEARMKKTKELRKGKVKEAVNRLYPGTTQSMVQTNAELDEEKAQQLKRIQFMRRLMTMYKMDVPNADNYMKPDILFPYWEVISNKEQEGLDGDPAQVKDNMMKYFQERCEILLDLFYKKKGYHSEQADAVAKFWTKSISNEERTKFQLNFECEQNIIDLLSEYIYQKKEEENMLHFMQVKMTQSKAKEDRAKLESKVLKGKNIKKSTLESLATPKDRMSVGKTLLELKKMHPDDKLLSKMILQEFQDNKIAKHPLEYDNHDSDEEKRIKIRHEEQRDGVVLKLEDLELPMKAKIEEISQLFENQLNRYYSTKNQELKKAHEKKEREHKDDMKLRRYIERAAEKYLSIRKRRFEEKVPTLNEYLSGVYKDILKQHRDATHRNFPHTTYGESKRLKKRSFPSALKRYFFACMKSFIKKKYQLVKDKQERLAFWAPPNTDGKAQTLNKKVLELSRQVKQDKMMSDRPETTVWDKQGFMNERQKIMMTFSDAKECTFTPMVCSRMPNKLKEHMKRTHNWATNVVDKKATFKHFLSQFGENFKRVPTVYKYGIYRRALTLHKKGDFFNSYKLIAEHFNIQQMKVLFKDPDRFKQHTIFDYEKMGIDKEYLDKLPREDEEDESYQNFLREVYNFIKSLEAYEAGVEASKRNLERMMYKTDQIFQKGFKSTVQLSLSQSLSATNYDLRKNLVKSEMCPLGQECPSLTARWPNSGITGVTPLGAQCVFAHHPFELRFAQELRQKKKILKDVLKGVNQRLNGEVKSKSWNPGGGIFIDCYGCGANLNGKGNKGQCSTCQMRKTNIIRMAQYSKMAKQNKSKILMSKSFREKDRERTVDHQHLNRKMAFLARASALYAKERYSEAFKIIVQAVELVKHEIEKDVKKENLHTLQVKTSLGFDKDMDITAEQIFLSTVPKFMSDDKQEPQKLHKFGVKTGLITGKNPNVNEFVNLQIEKMYLKIESALTQYVKDIDLMKQKIEKIEEEEDNVTKKRIPPHKTKWCQKIRDTGSCPEGDKCQFAHTVFELYLVSNEKKIENLNYSIKRRQEDIRDSKPPVSWMAAGVSGAEAYQDTKKMDRKADIKHLQQSPKRGLSKAKSFQDNHVKTIYEKDIDDIKTPIDERVKKKY